MYMRFDGPIACMLMSTDRVVARKGSEFGISVYFGSKKSYKYLRCRSFEGEECYIRASVLNENLTATDGNGTVELRWKYAASRPPDMAVADNLVRFIVLPDDIFPLPEADILLGNRRQDNPVPQRCPARRALHPFSSLPHLLRGAYHLALSAYPRTRELAVMCAHWFVAGYIACWFLSERR